VEVKGGVRGSRRGKQFVRNGLIFESEEVGTPVFIVERCIAAIRAAGTVYEYYYYYYYYYLPLSPRSLPLSPRSLPLSPRSLPLSPRS
jgi:hypothetical protein